MEHRKSRIKEEESEVGEMLFDDYLMMRVLVAMPFIASGKRV